MPDIAGLATRLPKDRGYSRASGFTETERAMGFVCPRANAYGGREGVIPPGVAAVRGIVPRGMHLIRPGEVANKANDARDKGVSDIDQYREYYGRGAAEQEAQAVQETQATRKSRSVPAAPAAPAVPAAPAAPAAKKGGRGRSRKQTPPPAEGVVRDPDDPGMFSKRPEPYHDDDTLDGFYDGLAGAQPGTGSGGAGAAKQADLRPPEPAEPAERAGGARGVPPTPRAHEPLSDALVQMAEEKAELKRVAESLNYQVGALQAQLRDAQRQLEGAAARDQHYARLEQEAGSRGGRPDCETVRAVLGAEGRMKVGGRGWECNLVGALHVGRSGTSAVLTVVDSAYGSELIASLQSAVDGAVVVVTEGGRTYCTYEGRCVKIYGEPGSQDFITMLWLDVAPDPDH